MFSVVKVSPIDSNTIQSKVEHTEGVFSNTLGDIDFFDRDVARQHKEYSKKYNMERKCDCRNERDNKYFEFENLNNNRRSRENTTILPNPNETLDLKKPDATPTQGVQAITSPNSINNMKVGYHLHKKHYCNRSNEKIPCPKHHAGHRLYYSSDSVKKGDSSLGSERIPRLCHKQLEPYIREIPKDEFKPAFRAGVSKSESSNLSSSADSGIDSGVHASKSPCIKNTLNIPKPRDPFTKKNYSINTLNPPFACYKGGAGQGGYPEHWRLASVYQHAYKPVENRKTPMLQTVFQ